LLAEAEKARRWTAPEMDCETFWAANILKMCDDGIRIEDEERGWSVNKNSSDRSATFRTRAQRLRLLDGRMTGWCRLRSSTSGKATFSHVFPRSTAVAAAYSWADIPIQRYIVTTVYDELSLHDISLRRDPPSTFVIQYMKATFANV
jgi:hypothetical protein